MRRATFTTGATAATLLLARRPARAATTLRVAVQPAIICTQAFCAQELGIFSKYGLSVETQILGSGAAIAAAMVGGAIDIGYGDPISLANGRLRGFNFAYIASGFLNTPAFSTTGLLIRPDSGVTDGKSLSGKTIGVNAINTFSSVVVQAWTDQNGGDAKSVKFLEVPFAQMVQDVDTGIVAGAFAGEPFVTIGRSRGLKSLVFRPAAPAPAFMASGWFALDSWIAANRSTARAFSDAMRDAAIWANANRDAAATIVEKTLKLQPNALHNLSLPPLFDEEPTSAAYIQPLIDAAVKYGALPKPIRATELIASLK
jgi:NitT/TauT family transport system substrate-binding protein